MFPDPSGATTTPAAIASKPQKHDDLEGAAERGRAPSTSSTESAAVKSPEPHWDSVIGAATD
jgi:hypothetical protein